MITIWMYVDLMEEILRTRNAVLSGSSCSSVGKRKKKKDIPNTVKVTFYSILCAYSVHCNYGFSRGKLNVYIT